MTSAGTPLRRSALPGWYGSGCPTRARAFPSVLASWTAPSASASHSRGLAPDEDGAGTCRLKRTLAPGILSLTRLSMSFRISAEREGRFSWPVDSDFQNRQSGTSRRPDRPDLSSPGGCRHAPADRFERRLRARSPWGLPVTQRDAVCQRGDADSARRDRAGGRRPVQAGLRPEPAGPLIRLHRTEVISWGWSSPGNSARSPGETRRVPPMQLGHSDTFGDREVASVIRDTA